MQWRGYSLWDWRLLWALHGASISRISHPNSPSASLAARRNPPAPPYRPSGVCICSGVDILCGAGDYFALLLRVLFMAATGFVAAGQRRGR